MLDVLGRPSLPYPKDHGLVQFDHRQFIEQQLAPHGQALARSAALAITAALAGAPHVLGQIGDVLPEYAHVPL
jgi:hypothetical protein